jgi:prepilin-type N-terminal cleavage/methylation domain-containing protein
MFSRAFSLLEVVVVVAMAGVLAAVALPSLLPVIHLTELGGATDNLLGFFAEARVRAMTDRRCVQVVAVDAGAAEQQRVVMRRLNTHDCDADDLTAAPRVNPAVWSTIDQLIFESPRVRASFDVGALAPADACLGIVAAECREVRFRPTGRIHSADADLTNDDVVVRVRHSGLSADKRFTLGGNGFVRLLPGGT